MCLAHSRCFINPGHLHPGLGRKQRCFLELWARRQVSLGTDTASVTRTVNPQPSNAACLERTIQFAGLYLAPVPEEPLRFRHLELQAGAASTQPCVLCLPHPSMHLTEHGRDSVVLRAPEGTVAALCEEQQERTASHCRLLRSWQGPSLGSPGCPRWAGCEGPCVGFCSSTEPCGDALPSAQSRPEKSPHGENIAIWPRNPLFLVHVSLDSSPACTVRWCGSKGPVAVVLPKARGGQGEPEGRW